MKQFAFGFGIALVVTFILNFSAHASQTLDLEEEYRDGNKKVCVYSDGRNTEVIRKSLGGSCPSKHIKR